MTPAMVDFGVQLASEYESTNVRRAATGFFFGASVMLSVGYALQGNLSSLLVAPVYFFGGFAWFLSDERRRHLAIQHLNSYAEYYIECRCGEGVRPQK